MTLPFVRGGTSSQPRRAGWVYRAVSCNQLQCEFTKSASESSSRLSLHPLSTSLYCKSLSVLSMHLLAPGVPPTYHFCSLTTTAGPLFLKCLIPRLSVARIPLLLLFFFFYLLLHSLLHAAKHEAIASRPVATDTRRSRASTPASAPCTSPCKYSCSMPLYGLLLPASLHSTLLSFSYFLNTFFLFLYLFVHIPLLMGCIFFMASASGARLVAS